MNKKWIVYHKETTSLPYDATIDSYCNPAVSSWTKMPTIPVGGSQVDVVMGLYYGKHRQRFYYVRTIDHIVDMHCVVEWPNE